jgi:hypothetical protein
MKPTGMSFSLAELQVLDAVLCEAGFRPTEGEDRVLRRLYRRFAKALKEAEETT